MSETKEILRSSFFSKIATAHSFLKEAMEIGDKLIADEEIAASNGDKEIAHRDLKESEAMIVMLKRVTSSLE